MDEYVNNAQNAEAAIDSYDNYIRADLHFPDANGNAVYGCVKKRVCNDYGRAVDIVNCNPLIDRSKYEVEYLDGYIEEITTNKIAENMLSHIYSQCNQFLLLKENNNKCKEASEISRADKFMTNKSENVHAKKTPIGWILQLEWKGGSSKWVPLVDLNHSNPVEFSEYAVANQLQEDPAFKWWVKYALCWQDQIISKVKTRYWRKTHSFGIIITKMVKEVLEIDKATGNNFGEPAIQKQMPNLRISFDKGAHTVEGMRDGKVLL